MRKKYLSALLFGALLVTSAGTFTSCKDYDDDINNLQEQITSNKDAIAALQKLVGEGKWVTSISPIENGFTVTMSDGTTTEIKGINGENGQDGKPGTMWKINEENNYHWEYSNDGGLTWVDTEVCAKGEQGETGPQGPQGPTGPQGPAGIDAKSPQIVNGEWVCYEYNAETGEYDAKPTGIKAEAVNIWAEDKGDYIILHVGEQAYELPANKEAATTLDITLGATTEFGGSTWGMVSAAKGVEWKGEPLPKGTVLLSNDNDKVTISLKPYTYELNQQKLKLVDTEGNYADADVTPTAKNVAEDGKPATRTVSVTGEWDLAVDLKDVKVSEDGNSITNYMYEGKNILYALEVNGKVVSPYKFVIATGSKNNTNVVANQLQFNTSDNSGVYELSFTEENNFTVKQTTTGHDNIVADAYLTFEGADADKANALDVTAEGLTIKGSQKAAGKSLYVTVHALGVNGSITKVEKYIKFAGSEVETGEISVADHKVTLDQTKSMMINVDGVFSYDDVQKMQFGYDNATHEFTNEIYGFDLSILKDEIGLFNTPLNTENPNYNPYSNCTLKAYKDKDKEEEFKFGVDAASDLNYIEFTTDLGYNSEAETGAYTLTLTLKEGVNEIKKVAANFNVDVPSFEEMFIKRTNIWDGNVVAFRTNVSGSVVNIYSTFGELYSLTADYSTLNPADAKFKLVNSSKTTANEAGVITVKDDVLKDGKVLKDITAKYEFPLGGKFKVVSPEFTIHPYSVVDGFTLKFYVKNTVKDAIEHKFATGFDTYVTVADALTGTGEKNKEYYGLAAFLNNKPAVIGTDLGVNATEISAKVITTGYADVEAKINNGALQLKNKPGGTQILKAPEGAVTSYDITVRVTIMDGAIKNTADYTVRITK